MVDESVSCGNVACRTTIAVCSPTGPVLLVRYWRFKWRAAACVDSILQCAQCQTSQSAKLVTVRVQQVWCAVQGMRTATRELLRAPTSRGSDATEDDSC